MEVVKGQEIITKDQQQSIVTNEANSLSGDIVEQLVKINGQRTSKVYQKLSLLGKGGFAECFLTQQKDTGRRAATKVIPKKLLDSHRTKLRLANEIKLNKSLHNEYVVELYNHFEDNENVYMNLEVCEFGSINDILRNRYTFTVPEVQSFLYGICQGLKYLHSQNIIHRDLKLGNIFLATNMKVKIGDFGLACKLEFDREYKRTVCGTPNYIAPEVLESKGYHFEVDVWALGVMVYTLFFTIPPFETEEPQTTYQKIRKGDYHFPRDYDVPFQAIDLIKRILVSSPALRPTIDQILDSPFMRLGGSIPLGLPPISLKRPPSRKELSYWPSLLTRDKQEPKNEGNSFVFEFLGLGRKRESVGKEEKPLTEAMRKEASLKQLRLGEEKARGIICVVIEQIEKSLVFFFLNNGNLGVCDTDKSEVYTCQLNEKCEYKQESLSLRRVNDSGAVQEEKIQFNNCPHRVVLGIKHKELLQKKAQINIEREVEKSLTISKLNIYKDVLMVKFNNKVIQVVFQEKDGFIISKDGRTTTYFNSFQSMEPGKQISYSSLMGAGSDKENRLCVNTILKTGKNEKSQLTLKKVIYLKGILRETLNHNLQANRKPPM